MGQNWHRHLEFYTYSKNMWHNCITTKLIQNIWFSWVLNLPHVHPSPQLVHLCTSHSQLHGRGFLVVLSWKHLKSVQGELRAAAKLQPIHNATQRKKKCSSPIADNKVLFVDLDLGTVLSQDSSLNPWSALAHLLGTDRQNLINCQSPYPVAQWISSSNKQTCQLKNTSNKKNHQAMDIQRANVPRFNEEPPTVSPAPSARSSGHLSPQHQLHNNLGTCHGMMGNLHPGQQLSYRECHPSCNRTSFSFEYFLSSNVLPFEVASFWVHLVVGLPAVPSSVAIDVCGAPAQPERPPFATSGPISWEVFLRLTACRSKYLFSQASYGHGFGTFEAYVCSGHWWPCAAVPKIVASSQHHFPHAISEADACSRPAWPYAAAPNSAGVSHENWRLPCKESGFSAWKAHYQHLQPAKLLKRPFEIAPRHLGDRQGCETSRCCRLSSFLCVCTERVQAPTNLHEIFHIANTRRTHLAVGSDEDSGPLNHGEAKSKFWSIPPVLSRGWA